VDVLGFRFLRVPPSTKNTSLHLLSMLAFLLSCVTFASFLGLYTAFSKTTKKLDFDQLKVVLTASKSVDHTLVELNKAISLNGLTCLALAFCPGFLSLQEGLWWWGMLQLWVHSCYSSYKYYGTNNIPLLSTWPKIQEELKSKKSKDNAVAVKKLSIIFGAIGQLGVILGVFYYVGPLILLWTGVGFGTLHFYTMEIDYKYVLHVRPWGFLPFALAPIGLVYYTFLA
jgi:hypothetical protein